MAELQQFVQGEVSQSGKIWALVSYAAHFFAIPVGIIPLVMGDDPYAVHHAKHAVAVYIGTLMAGVALSVVFIPLAFCTFGASTLLLIPLGIILGAWPLIHAIHGIIITLNGHWEEPVGTFGLGDRFFGALHIEKFRAAASAPPAHGAASADQGATSTDQGAAAEMTVDVPAEVSQR